MNETPTGVSRSWWELTGLHRRWPEKAGKGLDQRYPETVLEPLGSNTTTIRDNKYKFITFDIPFFDALASVERGRRWFKAGSRWTQNSQPPWTFHFPVRNSLAFVIIFWKWLCEQRTSAVSAAVKLELVTSTLKFLTLPKFPAHSSGLPSRFSNHPIPLLVLWFRLDSSPFWLSKYSISLLY